MVNLEKLALSYGENYRLGEDLCTVVDNLRQHLFTDGFKQMFPEVIDDLDSAKFFGNLIAEITGMSQDLETTDDPFTLALIIAGTCIRYALYCSCSEQKEAVSDFEL